MIDVLRKTDYKKKSRREASVMSGCASTLKPGTGPEDKVQKFDYSVETVLVTKTCQFLFPALKFY